MRVFDATTNTLTIGWDHAEGPVRQYRISYAPMTGDPITEFVSTLQKMLSANVNLVYVLFLCIYCGIFLVCSQQVVHQAVVPPTLQTMRPKFCRKLT